MFLVRLDEGGNILWTAQDDPATGPYTTVTGLGVDGEGAPRITGYFTTALRLDGVRVGGVSGARYMFLAKYSALGNLVWLKKPGGEGGDWAHSLTVAPSGNCYLTGKIGNTANFDAFTLQPVGGYDMFVACYDTDGHAIWAVRAGGPLDDEGLKIRQDRAESLIVSGRSNRVATFSKFTSSGQLLWTKQLGGASDDNTFPIASDPDGNLYVSGFFNGSLSFGITNLSSSGDSGFAAKYDSNGTILWARRLGAQEGDRGRAIAVDGRGRTFVGGTFSGTNSYDGNVLTGESGLFLGRLQTTMPVAPLILLQPVSQLVIAGTNAILSVVAEATPAPIYQWKFNGSDLVGATEATLQLNNVQTNNAGPYRVVVSNGLGSVTSAPAILAVISPQVTVLPLASVTGTAWKYLADGSNQGTAWKESTFDDSAWPSGVGLFGTESNPSAYPYPFNTVWPVDGRRITYYARTHVTLPSPLNVAELVFTNYVDDGCIIYLNGTEIIRYNMPAGSVDYLTLAPLANPGLEGMPVVDSIAAAPILPGDNVLAVEVHQNSATSSDVVFGLSLHAGIIEPGAQLNVAIQGQGFVNQSPDRLFYNIGEQVTLTAHAGLWHIFSQWVDGPAVNPRVITIGANNSYTAIFSPTTAVETLTFSNISRTAPIGMPAIFIDGEFVVTNEVSRLDLAEVSMLTTFPNGSIFYTLDGSAPSFAASLYSGPFVLRRSATVRAVAYDASFLNSWEADAVQVNIEPTFSVSLSTAGGGTVSVLPTAASYRSSSVVTLSAAPAPGWTFLQWLGDASGASATTSVRVMNRDLCAQALFGTTLNTTVAGSGSVVVDPAAALYPHGTVVRLTAVPQGGNHFGAWGNAVMSTNNPLLFTITNANPTVSCAFGSLSAGQVALTVLVDGRGRVTTSPRGNRFPSGQSIRLTATADADQEFLGWTGDATGTTTNLTVALTQSKVITANFTKRPRLSLGPCLGGWREEGFQLTLTGEFGEHYRIEQSSALENWGTLVSFTNTYGIWQMIDTAATNDTTRFYRALEER